MLIFSADDGVLAASSVQWIILMVDHFAPPMLRAFVARGTRPNILYLLADDMRPMLGCYGHTAVSTPNLDALAATGLTFDSAYAQYAYCAPSRGSFLSGRRPDHLQLFNFMTSYRLQLGRSAVSMIQFFTNAGYYTTAAGKIDHDLMVDPLSYGHAPNATPWLGTQLGDSRFNVVLPGDECDAYVNYCKVTSRSKISYTDEDLILAEGLKRMEQAHASNLPWLVGIGLHRPHTPWRLPAGWYGTDVLPDLDAVQPPKFPTEPPGVPYMAGNLAGGDIVDPAHAEGCPDCAVPTERSVEYRRWYYAAVAYADHMLGKALDKLSEMGVADRTITVFHSDHGYHLGELNEWSKKLNTELATRVPLIIRVPWSHVQGSHTSVRAELVDFYRTLVELAELDGSTIEPGVAGTSLAPLFQTGDGAEANRAALERKWAYSQIGSCECEMRHMRNWSGTVRGPGRCLFTYASDFHYMGYTVRDVDGWRYTVWLPYDRQSGKYDWSVPTPYRELYDLRADRGFDFDLPEYALNVVEQHAGVARRLHEALRKVALTWSSQAVIAELPSDSKASIAYAEECDAKSSCSLSNFPHRDL